MTTSPTSLPPDDVSRPLARGGSMGRKRTMAYPTSPSPASSSHLPGRGSRVEASEHQLEKLEFALAVALTRGDTSRTAWLRDQIAALGGNHEEPGT